MTDPSYLDAAIELCGRPDVVIATFGDLVRVPGTDTSLERERAAGANVRIVYSPSDALVLARECSSKHVVFLGVGFETTAPTIAWAIWRAARDDVRNFSVLCAHKTMPRAMDALLHDKELNIDGFLVRATSASSRARTSIDLFASATEFRALSAGLKRGTY